MKKIISVVGARPNFMKVAPVHSSFQKYHEQIKHLICHTGQHYDDKMSKVFFTDLELPQPDFYLGAGSGSHAEQTAKIMTGFEKVLLVEKPDLIIVVGDVNSTIACTLTAAKLKIKTAHIEAGLRSFDRDMPEEINRILTDSISDFLFVTEQSGIDNLKSEGIQQEKIYFVGNVMIDSLINYLQKTNPVKTLDKYKVEKNNFVLVTMHRPSNVDSPEQLSDIIDMLNKLSELRRIIFPVHPRTMKNLETFSLINKLNKEILITQPIGYLEFIVLLKNCELALTDSGGIQEETTYLGIQCITTRTTTERPVTTELGTNFLVGVDFSKAYEKAKSILSGNMKNGIIPPLWDGKTADRITEALKTNL